MEFKVERKRHRTESSYKKESIDLAYLFAKECHKEFKDLIKAIVLFGSTARKQQGSHDIDVLVLIDDISIKLTPEIIQTYRIITGRIINKISKKLHVTTLKFSSFWEYVLAGDPIAINILRDGFPLFDTGVFDPLQLLLHQGRIRPSPESIYSYHNRAKRTIHNAHWHIAQATIDLYWACIDSAHAALMKTGAVPPSPEQVPEMIKDHLVKTKIVPEKTIKTMSKFYHLFKEITNNKKRINGQEYDKLQKEAEEFVKIMSKVVEE